jgi:hypothetical protein
MIKTDETPKRDDIEDLLPWHAAGTLTPREARRVQAAVDGDPELARRLALAREEQAETVLLNESLGAPSSHAMDKLFARIDAEEERAPRRVRSPVRLGTWIGDQLSRLSPRALAWSAAAAALAIVLQAGLLLGLLLSETSGPGSFQTASGGQVTDAGAGAFVLLGFAEGATATDITAFLEARNASIVEGPRAGGLYRVRVADKALPQQELERIVGEMRAQVPVVRFVAPAS